MGCKESDLHIIYLTQMCNMKCDYCYETGKSRVFMTRETAKSVIDSIMSAYDKDIRVKILLFGGEPFLNWDVLYYCVDYIYNQYVLDEGREVRVLITSNGTLINEQKVRKLFRYDKVLDIEISIDGRKETHNKHRKFPTGVGSFDIVAKNAKTVLRYFPFTTARMVVSNLEDCYDDVKFLHDELGFKIFCIQAVRPNDGSLYTDEYRERFVQEIQRVEKYLSSDPFARVKEVYYPPTRTVYDKLMLESSQGINRDSYRYYLVDGNNIVRRTFEAKEFDHFNKCSNNKEVSCLATQV